MISKPGRRGKTYPISELPPLELMPPANSATKNTAPTAQASIVVAVGKWATVVVAFAALIIAIAMVVYVGSIAREVQTIRGMIENAASEASDSAVAAALAAERADKAERSAALSREYAVQVYPQLNRLGYPIMSPGEENHPAAQPEDYQRLDNFAETRK